MNYKSDSLKAVVLISIYNAERCVANELSWGSPGFSPGRTEIFRWLKGISPRLFHGTAGPALQGRSFTRHLTLSRTSACSLGPAGPSFLDCPSDVPGFVSLRPKPAHPHQNYHIIGWSVRPSLIKPIKTSLLTLGLWENGKNPGCTAGGRVGGQGRGWVTALSSNTQRHRSCPFWLLG